MSNEFPVITIQGGEVRANQYVEPGTGMYVVLASCAMLVGGLLLVLITWGVALIVFLIGLMFAWYVNRRTKAMIHGSGIKIDANQFPQIHDCVVTFSRRLGITPPEVYLVEANVANAVAVRLGKKNIILLTDDLIHGCLYGGIPQGLAYVLGHELAHIALNHNGLFRSSMRQALKKLSRLDEYSADRVAVALVGDKHIAFYGLLMLTVGYSMLAYVNLEQVVAQAGEVAANKFSKKAERMLTHPLLLNRLGRVMESV
jgi:Zn-dependent protease with chaperone function